MKKKWFGITGLLALTLTAGLTMAGCDTGGGPSDDGLFTYIATFKEGKQIAKQSQGRSPGRAAGDVSAQAGPVMKGTLSQLLEALSKGAGEIDDVLQLNRDPDPDWLKTPADSVEITDTSKYTNRRYLAFVQVQRDEQNKPDDSQKNGDHGDAEYNRCYDWDSVNKRVTHKPGENWYFLLYDNKDHKVYGDDHTLFITPDFQDVKVFKPNPSKPSS